MKIEMSLTPLALMSALAGRHANGAGSERLRMEGDGMSGLLALIYLAILIGVPVIAVSWAWRRWTKAFQRGIAVFGGFLGMLGVLWLALSDQWAADKQVRELCAKDGGVRVYETVKLPAEKFDKYGVTSIPKMEDARSDSDYYYISETQFIRHGNPELWRLHFQVIRRADGKVLGEATTYARRGGDMPGPWHDSSFGCEKNADITDLKKQLFVSID